MKFNKTIISTFMIFVILLTMSAAFAADQDWNDYKFSIPDGFSVGTPGVEKVGMMDGKQSVILEKYNESRLEELKGESEPSDELTYKIEDTDISETVFDTETGKAHFLKFNKDGQDFDLVYEEFIGEDEEDDEDADDESEDDESEDDSEDDESDDNSTDDNSTDDAEDDSEDDSEDDEDDDEDDDSFDASSPDSPANLIIRSLSVKG